MLNVDLSPTKAVEYVDHVIRMNRAAFDRIPVYQVPPNEPPTPILFATIETDYWLTDYAYRELHHERGLMRKPIIAVWSN